MAGPSLKLLALKTRQGDKVRAYFRDPDHLGECRLAAMRLFLADFERGKQEGRYAAASLSKLPFADIRFPWQVG